MAKVTWLGEDDLHTDDRGGPSHTTWNGIRFDKGKAVEVTNPKAIEKAKGNPFFKVEGEPEDEAEHAEDEHGEEEHHEGHAAPHRTRKKK